MNILSVRQRLFPGRRASGRRSQADLSAGTDRAHRILLALHSGESAGAELVAVALARYLRDRGAQVLVTVPRGGPLVRLLEDSGIPFHIVPTPWWCGERGRTPVGLTKLVLAALALPVWIVLLNRLKPDLVWTQSAVIPTPAVAAKMLRLPHVWSVQESLLTNPSLNSIVSKQVICRLIGDTSLAVVAISHFVQGQLRDGGTRGEILMSPPQRDITRPPLMHPDVQGRGASDVIRLLFVGTFGSDKGLEDVIQAVASANAAGAHYELTIAGGGRATDLRRVRRSAARLGLAPNWLGWVQDVRSLYAGADLLVMASKNEAYGMVTLEAVQQGLPVVGFSAGATPEIVGEQGILVPVVPGALARLLSDLDSDRVALATLIERWAHSPRSQPDPDLVLASLIDRLAVLGVPVPVVPRVS